MKSQHPELAVTTRYRDALPQVISATYAIWEATGRTLPLDALLVGASRRLRRAIEEGRPASLALLPSALSVLAACDEPGHRTPREVEEAA